jgi:hypothetical protein
MTINFYSTYPVIFFSRPITSPPADWTEIEIGPGPISLPENQEYGFRIHNIDNQDLKHLVAEIATVTPLTYINLSENRKITNPGLAYLSDFSDLVELNLSSCSLTNDAMAHLQGFSHLSALDLSYCNRLTGPALKYLRHLPKLAALNLQGCIKITNGDVARFKKRGLVINK